MRPTSDHTAPRCPSIAALASWIEESNDLGRMPEAPEIHQCWERQMQQNYDACIDAMLEVRRRRCQAR